MSTIKHHGEQEYCPRCRYPIEPNQSSGDTDRLCVACGWFGDESEVAYVSHPLTTTEQAFVRIVELYSDLCAHKVKADAMCEVFPEHVALGEYITRRVEHAKHCLLFAFRKGTEKNNPEDSE